MKTLEDRLRAALVAKSDGVAFSMLTRSLPALEVEPDAEPVIPLPSYRPHRSRRMLATALAVAAVLLVAFGAVALHQATNAARFGPAHVRPRSAIPWDEVGNGWMLQIAEPGTVDVPGGAPGWLYLIDPGGVLYRICKVPQNAYGYGFPEPTAWGQPFNTDRVIMLLPTDNSRSSLLEIDLRSGAQRVVTVLGHWSTAEFVDAAGNSILLYDADKMVKVNAGTGQIQTRFDGTEFYGSLISADRTQVVTGSETALSVLDIGTGRIVRRIANPSGYHFCMVNSWLPGTARFVARCQQVAAPHAALTFDFSLDGATPPMRPAVPAGWDEVDLAGGKIAIKTSRPYIFEINDMAFTRISPSGSLEPIAVPEQLNTADWGLYATTPAGFVLEYLPPSTSGLPDDMALWDPFTGRFQFVFRSTENRGPHGLWTGWRTTRP